MNLPRIHCRNQKVSWLARASIVDYPYPGTHVEVDLYSLMDSGEWVALPVVGK